MTIILVAVIGTLIELVSNIFLMIVLTSVQVLVIPFKCGLVCTLRWAVVTWQDSLPLTFIVVTESRHWVSRELQRVSPFYLELVMLVSPFTACALHISNLRDNSLDFIISIHGNFRCDHRSSVSFTCLDRIELQSDWLIRPVFIEI